ncbi:MAG: peptidase M23 [Gammaproteobacteria bacterium]|nr:MAG: peptidase M23 [Gammaproteobacteria bacterium]
MLTLGIAQPCGAESRQETEKQLEAVRSLIESMSHRLGEARGERDALQVQLREAERKMGSVARRIRDIDKKLVAKNQALEGMRRRQGVRKAALSGQRSVLAGQLRAAYATGRQDYLKILLNQEDPAALARVITYYRYFNQARVDRIGAIRDELLELQRMSRAIELETTALEQLRSKGQTARQELGRFREARARVLQDLMQEISDGGGQLGRLQQNKARLENLLTTLRQELSDIPTTLGERDSFRGLKGRLPWPVAGRIKHRFGTLRPASNLKWSGVWISAAEGEPVGAVAHGRVAFADWLRGFGLLAIVDHGDGFMSLYGHSQSLYKEAGDWVEAGEMLATVGDSGGSTETGLYFEIRQNAAPRNPVAWCQGRRPPPGKPLVSR